MKARLDFSGILATWGSDAGMAQLRQAIEALPAAVLPLQQALAHSSQVSATPHRVRIIAWHAVESGLEARVGIFYTGIVAGCNCADDPTPPNEENEYCELLFSIERATGLAQFRLLEACD